MKEQRGGKVCDYRDRPEGDVLCEDVKRKRTEQRSEWECAHSTLADNQAIGGQQLMWFLRYRGDTRRDRLNGYTWIIQVRCWYASAMVGWFGWSNRQVFAVYRTALDGIQS